MKKDEARLQEACVRWFRYQHPRSIIAAIPNGGSRNALEASSLKRQGVLAGMPDLFIALTNADHCGLFVELKAGKNKTTDRQDQVISKLKEAGYSCEVLYTFEAFVELINNYIHGNTGQPTDREGR